MSPSTATSLGLLQRLTEAHGTSGHEDAVRELALLELKGVGTFSCDRLGSIQCQVAASEGTANPPTVMITAHMDEVGFAVQNITDKGFIQLVALGGWWTHTVLGQRLRLKTAKGKEILGIVTSTPPHFLPESERSKVLALEQLYVDIGATSRKEVEEKFGLRLGDPAVPESAFGPFGIAGKTTRYVGKAFDNRVGCAVVIEALKAIAQDKKRPNLAAGVLTVQEEVGCRGAITATALAKPDVALVMEGTPADDTPGTPASAGGQGTMGKGVQIRLLDPTALMSRRLVDFLISVAEKKNIPYQLAVRRSGGTDAKSIHTSGVGVPAVVLGVPARYIHSHNSVIDLDDYRSALALATEATRKLDAKTVAGLADFLS